MGGPKFYDTGTDLISVWSSLTHYTQQQFTHEISLHIIIGASVSEPHASEFNAAISVCLFVCLVRHAESMQ